MFSHWRSMSYPIPSHIPWQVAFAHAICVERARSHGYHLLRMQDASLLSSAYSAFRASGVLVPPSSKAHTGASSAISLLQLGGQIVGSAAESEPSLTARLVAPTSDDASHRLGNVLLLATAITGMAAFFVRRSRTRMGYGLHPVSLEEPEGSVAARYGTISSSSAAGYGTIGAAI
jgi:hypothetical protein